MHQLPCHTQRSCLSRLLLKALYTPGISHRCPIIAPVGHFYHFLAICRIAHRRQHNEFHVSYSPTHKNAFFPNLSVHDLNYRNSLGHGSILFSLGQRRYTSQWHPMTIISGSSRVNTRAHDTCPVTQLS